MIRRGFFLIFIVSLWVTGSFAQNTFTCTILNSQTEEPVQNASVVLKGSRKGVSSDVSGKVIMKNIPAGKQTLVFSSVGYKEQVIDLVFPLSVSEPAIKITLEQVEKLEDPVIISSSRTDSRIENTPTRVEVLGSEELEEESTVKPGNIASLLGDVAGIQMQQTSAVTGNTDLRIQGLPGNYTQILRDGMPLFGGYAGSFSILQIPPMDIKQIEIIKGANSTLYGGGAIAGLINIISKKPREGIKERSLLLSQSTLKESNINLFLTERSKKFGYTFFGGGNYQREVDVDKDGFSDIGAQESFFIHPILYFYFSPRSTLSFGFNSNYEERNGGDMKVLERETTTEHQFFIQNQSNRNTADVVWEYKVSPTDRITLKGTASRFNRNMTSNVFGMKARQISFYFEGSYLQKTAKHDVVIGINGSGENYKKRLPDSSGIHDYKYFTMGFFVQDDWYVQPKITIESGVRIDFHNKFGTFLLPRISVLYKISPVVTSRLGAGLGYKIPSAFANEIDEREYLNFSLEDNAKVERSFGANWDVNYKKVINSVTFAINQSFFYTQINHPLVAFSPPGFTAYYTEIKPITTLGSETWLQVSRGGLDAYFGFTFTDARKKYDAVNPHLDLTAATKAATVISYEFSKRFRACIEASYIGKKYLEDGSRSPGFALLAGMIRYDIGHCSFVINCENILDYRQTKKESIITPPLINPSFKQLWGPIDGRVANVTFKVNL